MKINTLQSYLLALLFFLSLGCKKNNFNSENDRLSLNQPSQTVQDTFFVSKSIALKKAEAFNKIENSFNNKRLSSADKISINSNSQSIKNIFTVKPDPNRKESFYIINYKNGGFTIVSADKRTQDILAFGNSGTIDSTTTELPSGLITWLEETDAYINNVRSNKSNLDKKAILKSSSKMGNFNTSSFFGYPMIPGGWSPGDPRGDYHEYVLLPFNTTWDQGVGYNDALPSMSCTTNSNGKPYTGCVATAVAQVLKYHQWPANYDWNSMPNSYGSPATALLMADIGNAVGMNYGCDGSGAQTSKIPNILVNVFNYHSTVSYQNVNAYAVGSDLASNQPVILAGGSKEGWWIFASYKDGHAWVCDGYKSDYTVVDFTDPGGAGIEIPVIGQSSTFLHMNWGWGGVYNNWFAAGNWNPGSSTFNYKTQMVSGIIPKNR